MALSRLQIGKARIPSGPRGWYKNQRARLMRRLARRDPENAPPKVGRRWAD